MNIRREQIQKEITHYIDQLKDTIVLVSIRVGKTRAAINAIEEGEKVLVVYPFTSIKKSWEAELEKVQPASRDITFTTTRSLKKFEGQEFDFVIVDEPQYLSAAQIKSLSTVRYKKRVGLTGTLNSETKKTLALQLGWEVGYTYDISDAIRDGIVKDYQINIHFVDLDDQIKIPYKAYGKDTIGTEKQIYKYYSDTMDYYRGKQEEAETSSNRARAAAGFQKYMGLRTNLLYNSPSLLNACKQLVESLKDQKVLIYTLRTEIADSLSDASYHSKSKEEEIIETFKVSEKGHCAVVNCVQAGVTIKHLNQVVFHSYDSNTENLQQKLGRSLLYEFEGQKSTISIFALRNTQMERWIDSACKSLEQDKISYCFNGKCYGKIEWLKLNNPGKLLYLYNGTVCYYSHDEQNGQWVNKHYRFLDNPHKSYSLNSSKLIQI